ncbi:methyltransferase domain-containing protein [bacterium]|nr:methyltransferase domain-containing protein [bacterium]
MQNEKQDAFGQLILSYHEGRGGHEIIERDDGLFEVSFGPAGYFTTYEDWREAVKESLTYAKRRVLDIGCGAGRYALHLQEKGHQVLGIDNSPLAIEVCRKRGLLEAECMSVTQVTKKIGKFETILMMGANFGLMENFKRARWLLKRFKSITNPGACIIAQTRDPYQTDAPEHLEYHERNRQRGRMSGQVRIRVRCRKQVTPFFDYLFVSKQEMEEIIDGTGWEIERFIDQHGGLYLAVIRKVG